MIVVKLDLIAGWALHRVPVPMIVGPHILHIENPVGLLEEARRILVPGGKVGIIHWRSDIATPRGPSLEIRPKPEECRAWGEEAGLAFVRYEGLSCCSYHYGLVMERPD